MLSLPYTQRWMAGRVSEFLSEFFETEVRIGRIQLSLSGHAIADDFNVLDQQGRLMLSATRVGAEVSLRRLINSGDVIVNSAQLYGVSGHAIQDAPDTPLNFQFIIDHLSGEKTNEKKDKRHIEVRTIMVRHTNLTYDRMWKERKDGFDVNHLYVNDLSMTGKLDVLDDDTLSVTLRKLSFSDLAGLSLNEGSGNFSMGLSGYRIKDIHLGLPNSTLDIPSATYNEGVGNADIKANILPLDLKTFYPALDKLTDFINIDCSVAYDKEQIRIGHLIVQDSYQSIDASLSGEINIDRFLKTRTDAKPNTYTAKGSHVLTQKPSPKEALPETIRVFLQKLPGFDVNINKLYVSSNIDDVIHPFVKQPIRLVSQLGEASCKGTIQHTDNYFSTKLNIVSSLGNVDLNGTLIDERVKAHTKIEKLQLGKIISLGKDSITPVKTLSGTFDTDVTISGPDKLPEGQIKAVISEFDFKGYNYHNIDAEIKRHGTFITADIKSQDPSALGTIKANVDLAENSPAIQGVIDIAHLNLLKAHLVKSTSKVHWLDVRAGIDLSGNTLDNMGGSISVPHIVIGRDSVQTTLTNIQLLSQPVGNERHVTLNTPYIKVNVDGAFKFKDLIANIQNVAHSIVPSFVSAPQHHTSHSDLSLNIDMIDPSPLKNLLGIDLSVEDGPLHVHALLNTNAKQLETNLSARKLRLGNNEFHNLDFILQNIEDNLMTSLHAESNVKGVPLKLDVEASLSEQQISTDFKWRTESSIRNEGQITCSGTVERRTQDGVVIYANFSPTDLYLNDTLWNVHPSQLYYRNNELYVDNFEVSMLGGKRSIAVYGTASKRPTDILNVDLKQIDLAYVLAMAKLRPISLGGLVSGHITGHSLFSSPVATGHVTVPNFLFNEAHMGSLDANLSWNVTPGSLGINGHVFDPSYLSDIRVNGDIHLIKDPTQHLNLDIACHKANAAFMQRYVSGIMDDFEGRVSGNARIYGTFREIDLEGDVFVNEVGLTIPVLNTRYHAYNDSVHIRPGVINLKNIRAYDKFGGPDRKGTEHSAIVNGQLTHRHFSDLRFNIDVEGKNVLAYDTHSFDDGAFYATCLGSGKVHLEGEPGKTTINIDATPLRGTSLTYNAESPDALTHAGFLTFVDRSEQYLDEEEKQTVKAPETTWSDMFINFNVNLTPEAQLRLLMDAKTGDYITLYGSGQMGARYYNKGNFQLFGTTRIDHGTYKLTLQDVIHKEFQLRQGGTITFNGAPMQADLDIQAIYTVPSVSLNDLSMRGTFSNNNVRVNCLMNIDGKAAAPHLTFDFELPNVNEEEARMVRSLISTEEERNLQVVYLLGIGRFYTFDYANAQNQSSTAMNSLLSTTISGQINQVMSSIIGSSDWNFGANVATGNNGWEDVDVEGMLSGRMLNNRLIFNGNFGYRDNPVAQSNFVGDFDLQWLLTKNGNLVLKAYSETNDRYFTKSSLTTQGVGLMAKKEFSNFRNFFTLTNLRKRKLSKPKSAK